MSNTLSLIFHHYLYDFAFILWTLPRTISFRSQDLLERLMFHIVWLTVKGYSMEHLDLIDSFGNTNDKGIRLLF